MVSGSIFQIDLPAALIERVKAGDTAAFEQIYRRFERPVYTLVLRMLGESDAARDALHDAMLKAFQHIGQFRGDAPFWAWLRQIALNEALMRLRVGDRFIVSLDASGADADAFADDAPAPWAHADARMLEHALARLPAVTRSVLWLYHVEGYTHPEIAAAMRKSTSFSKSQLARGTLRLRALPLAAPPGDEWAVLRERLQKPEQRPTPWRRYVLPAALAAALAGAFVLLRAPQTSAPATDAPTSASSSVNDAATAQIHNAQNAASHFDRLAQLQLRSQALERWLRQTGRDAAPLQGQDLAAAIEIENLIGLVDVELAAPRQTQAQTLWQRRVGLLEDLAALRYSNYRLAAGGRVAASWQID